MRHSILQITQGRAKADYRWLVQTHILILIGRRLYRFLLRGRIFPKISWTPCRPPSPWLPWRVDRHMWGTPGPWHGWWQWWLTQATSASAYWDISGSLHSNGICKRGPKLLLLVAISIHGNPRWCWLVVMPLSSPTFSHPSSPFTASHTMQSLARHHFCRKYSSFTCSIILAFYILQI